MSIRTAEPSGLRTPKCPYFRSPTQQRDDQPLAPGQARECGGCATQHLTYQTQLENKKKRLIREIGYEKVEMYSDEEWFYRNRMDMVFTDGGLGFKEKGKWWRTLPVKQCVISNHRLNELITEINTFFGPDFDAFNLKTQEGTYKHAVIRTPQNDSSVSIVLNKESPRYDKAVEKVKAFAQVSTANNVLLTNMKAKQSQSIGEDFEVLKGSDMLEETILGKTFHYSCQGFFQNNSIMAEKMHAYVRGLLRRRRDVVTTPSSSGSSHLLDLYGGVGAFGIINADLFDAMTTVESFEGCTVAAKANIERNGLKNAQAICMDAKRLKQVKLPSGPQLTVITDPPRSGMAQETIIQLNKLAPEHLIYISCNVEQLGKDLPKFKNYKIQSAALFDLFPQTNHMESVVELVKRA